jgi:hypothetical protein
MSKKKATAKFATIMTEFLKNREWSDELETDSEENTVTLRTGITVKDTNGRLIIECNEKTEIVRVYIYYATQCKKVKMDQMKLLLASLQCRMDIGAFCCFEDGYIRWQQTVNFEGSEPTSQSIEGIVQPAWYFAGLYESVILEVATAKTSATEALEEFDKSRGEPNNDEDNESGNEDSTSLKL